MAAAAASRGRDTPSLNPAEPTQTPPRERPAVAFGPGPPLDREAAGGVERAHAGLLLVDLDGQFGAARRGVFDQPPLDRPGVLGR